MSGIFEIEHKYPHQMNYFDTRAKMSPIIILMVLSFNLSACGSSTSWKEEIILRDGVVLVANRAMDRGGRHEIGHRSSSSSQTLTFRAPGSDMDSQWKDEFDEKIGGSSFSPITLDIHGGYVYLVAIPLGCLSYNKWGRPNPPYVIFKQQEKSWARIRLGELPLEINEINMTISSPDQEANKLGGYIKKNKVKELNSSFRRPEFLKIIREELSNYPDCPVPTNAKAEEIAPMLNGQPLRYNWWPLAQDWLNNTNRY